MSLHWKKADAKSKVARTDVLRSFPGLTRILPLPVAEQFEQIVSGTDQFPLAGGTLQAAEPESADAAQLFDLAEDWLDHGLS